MVILDHQTFYLGSPVPDLLWLIALATDKSFRDQYKDKLVEYYYTQLSDAFRRINIDPETTYSKEDFYAELKEVSYKVQATHILGRFRWIREWITTIWNAHCVRHHNTDRCWVVVFYIV